MDGAVHRAVLRRRTGSVRRRSRNDLALEPRIDGRLRCGAPIAESLPLRLTREPGAVAIDDPVTGLQDAANVANARPSRPRIRRLLLGLRSQLRQPPAHRGRSIGRRGGLLRLRWSTWHVAG